MNRLVEEFARTHHDLLEALRTQVHLEMVENFKGADLGEFTLYTALDGSACGFDFAEGETYLVEAYKKIATDTWDVSSCSRTRLLGQATEDLKYCTPGKLASVFQLGSTGRLSNL
jgi:hypothetical protein